jgi:hypothetical protein
MRNTETTGRLLNEFDLFFDDSAYEFCPPQLPTQMHKLPIMTILPWACTRANYDDYDVLPSPF